MLATVATIALGMPAVAADQGHSSTMDPTRNQAQTQQQWSQQQNAQGIAPSDLDASQIRQIQQALNKHGFDAGNVDGVWGSETREAVENFQEKRNIESDQALNQETLSALGVDFGSNMDADRASTTGASTTGSGATETTGSGFEASDANPGGVEASDMDGNPDTAPSGASQ
jgi:peptidoglycan hydrolase-like protein with peptidoglycan-binding domain